MKLPEDGQTRVGVVSGAIFGLLVLIGGILVLIEDDPPTPSGGINVIEPTPTVNMQARVNLSGTPEISMERELLLEATVTNRNDFSVDGVVILCVARSPSDNQQTGLRHELSEPLEAGESRQLSLNLGQVGTTAEKASCRIASVERFSSGED